MLENLISQMVKAQGVTEELKTTDQMKWVQAMNNIKARAREIVNTELIYTHKFAAEGKITLCRLCLIWFLNVLE